MAKSGVEESQSSFNYDVYLSFRGEDTRQTFIGYLRKELNQSGITTFTDEMLGVGELISPALFKAIEESKGFIVVLSDNYASSTWCLDELVKILDCSRKGNQCVFPIFYHVDPSHVRHQKGKFDEAMIAHENRFGKNSDKVQTWRSALKEVCQLVGCHIRSGDDENGRILDILEHIRHLLGKERYDIFLSFRGKDTRNFFTNDLYHALKSEGFKIFMDDEEIETGSSISEVIVQAIENSRLSIIIFSENFADSTWCLDEVYKILKCKEQYKQRVWPIFYKVDPSDVRHQKKSYKIAMAEQEMKFGNDSEKVKSWRLALSQVCDLKAFEYKKDSGPEGDFIQGIVKAANKIRDRL